MTATPAPLPAVLSVNLSPRHTFSKHPQPHIQLLAGLGVEGDAHCGATVRHRYLARRDPSRPNLTQVHLLQTSFFDVLRPLGLILQPGDMGENITVSGLDLLSLPSATRLGIGPSSIVEITGLRTPCIQMNRLHPGLMAASFAFNPQGRKTPRAGIMAVVVQGGIVHPGDPVLVHLPPTPYLPLQRV